MMGSGMAAHEWRGPHIWQEKIEALEKENAALKAELVEWQTGDRRYHPDVLAEELRERCREVNTLKAELVALKAQEPVAFVCKTANGTLYLEWPENIEPQEEWTKVSMLFTAPQAQGWEDGLCPYCYQTLKGESK